MERSKGNRGIVDKFRRAVPIGFALLALNACGGGETNPASSPTPEPTPPSVKGFVECDNVASVFGKAPEGCPPIPGTAAPETQTPTVTPEPIPTPTPTVELTKTPVPTPTRTPEPTATPSGERYVAGGYAFNITNQIFVPPYGDQLSETIEPRQIMGWSGGNGAINYIDQDGHSNSLSLSGGDKRANLVFVIGDGFSTSSVTINAVTTGHNWVGTFTPEDPNIDPKNSLVWTSLLKAKVTETYASCPTRCDTVKSYVFQALPGNRMQLISTS